MKKFVSILVGLMILPLLALGAAYDATLSNSGAQIAIGSNTFVLSGRESLMDSVTVNESNISIVTTAGVFFQLTSADKLDFTVSPSQYKAHLECQSNQSILTVEASQDVSTTITVTPGSACSVDGGGGGSSYSYAAATPATPAVPSVFPATPAAPALTSASAVAKSVSPAFNRELERGSKGDDVTNLQQQLAKDPSLYPEAQVTGYYGALTQKAVRAFQKKYGISQVGRVGPQTLKKLNEVFSGAAPTSQGFSQAEMIAKLQAQIESLLKQIQELLAKKNQ